MKGFPDLPPIWLLGTMGLSWAVAEARPFASTGQVGLWVGAGVILLGLGIIAWSALWFWRKRTPIEPHHRPRTLIVEGPYRLSRNPIYLGLLLLALGWALSLGPFTALVPVPVLWWVLDRRFAAVEEAVLRDSFGAEAKAYLAATRRWL
ncbi:isoprenylcysteine carboxylmethyltransferase family protein [Jannaschia sp. M317]|uniref:methyltransferase family protein n=1 Tax=Jannaschia sp. M317 TaxID=2867011 RepID=UPI0021A86F4E|nr:isoprenylcysteine carboxylmethyltransferase family protein [Jannaschia sp. M317]UWQ17085.1 isoprenylcysteine carboxylmethyltransferase family protein [Jannaschia sp. M317]